MTLQYDSISMLVWGLLIMMWFSGKSIPKCCSWTGGNLSWTSYNCWYTFIKCLWPMFEVATLRRFQCLPHLFRLGFWLLWMCESITNARKPPNVSHRRLTIKSLPFFQWKTIFSSLLLHLQMKEKRHFRQYGKRFFLFFTLWPRKTPYQEALWDDRPPAFSLQIFRIFQSDIHRYTTNCSDIDHHCATACNFSKCQ